ncbi:MAG: putative fumarate reductase flavoprotein subunit [Dehalococcoidia bacterium]|nr:putative fumarate reductase flavoprotein subunit [Dehalococcoidia bacterium]
MAIQESVTDVLVIGGGTAGCLAAVSARQQGAQVVVAEKASVSRSGAMSSGLDHYPAILGLADWDTPEAFLNTFDTHPTARPGLTSPRLMEVYAREVKGVFDYMESIGVPFKDAKTGQYVRSAGPGWAHPYLVHFEGARIKPILAENLSRAGVKMFNHIPIQGLLTHDHRVVGAAGFNVRTGDFHVIKARAVVITTGAVTRLYPPASGLPFLTATPPYNTGEGHVMAFEAGVALTNMEFPVGSVVPRGFAVPCITNFLGHDAHLTNARDERYMFRYHPSGEGAPRGLVAMATFKEYSAGRGPCNVDCRHLPEETIARIKLGLLNEKALLLEYLAGQGIDIARDPIPFVVREFDYLASGILIDERCQSTLEGLFAAGDCVNFGLGASGACTLGYVAGREAARHARVANGLDIDRQQIADLREKTFSAMSGGGDLRYSELETELRRLMYEHVGWLRDASGMSQALRQLDDLKDNARKLRARNFHELMRVNEAAHLVDVAQMITIAALERKESRAVHQRADFPQKDDLNWRGLVVLTKGPKGKISAAIRPVTS